MSSIHENPSDIVGAAQAMLAVSGYGEKPLHEILNIQVPEKYKEAVMLYGGYSQKIYETPAIARLISQYYYLPEHQDLIDITNFRPEDSQEHIFLGMGDSERPKLLFVASAHTGPNKMEEFKMRTYDLYSNESGNPFRFIYADRLYGDMGSHYLHYYLAMRNFSADVLWKNHDLFTVFVDRTKSIFQNLQQKLREGVKVPNQEQRESILQPVIQANAILSQALGHQ